MNCQCGDLPGEEWLITTILGTPGKLNSSLQNAMNLGYEAPGRKLLLGSSEPSQKRP
jgi:hypothetical protein